MTIHGMQEGTNKLFEYNGNNNSRVYDGWINADYDFNQSHKKELVIEDINGNEMFRKEAGNWDINKQYNLGVAESLTKSGF